MYYKYSARAHIFRITREEQRNASNPYRDKKESLVKLYHKYLAPYKNKYLKQAAV